MKEKIMNVIRIIIFVPVLWIFAKLTGYKGV